MTSSTDTTPRSEPTTKRPKAHFFLSFIPLIGVYWLGVVFLAGSINTVSILSYVIGGWLIVFALLLSAGVQSSRRFSGTLKTASYAVIAGALTALLLVGSHAYYRFLRPIYVADVLGQGRQYALNYVTIEGIVKDVSEVSSEDDSRVYYVSDTGKESSLQVITHGVVPHVGDRVRTFGFMALSQAIGGVTFVEYWRMKP